MLEARGEGRLVAAALLCIDRALGRAYGRYWGSVEEIRCLHFEACYYQPLQWAIEQGFACFEGGAQGEHKMSRGLLPAFTHSAHRLSHPDFARAVDDFLQQEDRAMTQYVSELEERNPFKPGTPITA